MEKSLTSFGTPGFIGTGRKEQLAIPVGVAIPAIQHRIVQFQNRRYSLKLGADVWNILTASAKRRGMRLNFLIGEVARSLGPDANLSAALRAYCIEELKFQVESLKADLRSTMLHAGGVSVEAIADAIPSPCFVINQNGIVVKCNLAAEKWLGMKAEALLNQPIDHYIQIKAQDPLSKVMADFATGSNKIVAARALCLRPGKLVAAKAALCPMTVRSESDFLYSIVVDALL